MNMTQMPAYMQPEAWTQFWQNQTNANPNVDMMRVIQQFSQLQNQYMQRMMGEWQQLTLAMSQPESLPQECNKFMKRAAENTMEHAQNIMQVVQTTGSDAMKACSTKAASGSKKA